MKPNLIVGASQCGKSMLVLAIMEAMAKQGGQFIIIDSTPPPMPDAHILVKMAQVESLLEPQVYSPPPPPYYGPQKKINRRQRRKHF